MANKVRGDYELDDLAVQLISKINHLRGVHLKAAPFEEELTRMLQEGAFVELWTKLVDASGVLFKADNKEITDVYNIVFELLDTIDKDEGRGACETLAQKVVTIVADPDGDNAETRLIVLANLYNAAFISDFSELRFSVLRSLVRYASAQKKLSSVESFLIGTTDLFATLSHAPTLVQRQTLLDIYEALRAYGDATNLEQTYLIKYLSTFDKEEEQDSIDAGVQTLACTAIGASIGNVLAANGRRLLNLAAVKSLASAGGSKTQLFALLQIFNDGLLADYLAFHKDKAAVLKEFGIDHEQALRSMRLLSLCSTCSNAQDGTITYAEAAKNMGLEGEEGSAELAAELESWVMMGIKNGLIDVKMCQQTQKIIVYASTQRNFQPQQWTDMKKKLTRWKSQISKLLVTVKNIQMSNQLRLTGGRVLR